MIRSSLPGDEQGLKHLWQTAFGDSPKEIDAFFSALYHPGDAVVWVESEVIASAAYLLDAGTLTLPDGRRLTAAYTYALATLPAFRGRGLGSAVVRAGIARSFELGFDCNVIRPTEAALFPYYARLGYTSVFSIVQGDVCRSASFSFSSNDYVMSTDFSTYLRLRAPLLPAASTDYPPEYLRFAALSYEASGGGLYRLEIDGQSASAAVSRCGDTLFVPEILPASLAERGAALLIERLAAASAVFRTAPGSASLPTRPFVLVAQPPARYSPVFDGYFPFVLD